MAGYSRKLRALPSPLLNYCPHCLPTPSKLSRLFSSTPSRLKAIAMAQKPSDVANRMLEGRKSRKVEMKNLPQSRIPDDVGLLPETFIRPPSREMPRLLSSEWKRRLKLEWLWVRTRVQNFGSYVQLYYPFH
jgi:hypothetical protein